LEFTTCCGKNIVGVLNLFRGFVVSPSKLGIPVRGGAPNLLWGWSPQLVEGGFSASKTSASRGLQKRLSSTR